MTILFVALLAVFPPAFADSSQKASETYASYIVKNKKELSQLWSLAETAKGDAKAWYFWQIGLNSPLVNDLNSAIVSLRSLSQMPQTLIPKDQIHLNLGRVYYQAQNFNKALESYKLVGKSSEFWFEAMEEQGWALVRLNKPSEALSKTSTLLLPVFRSWVGPETYYLANYNNLKICDYLSVFKINQTFKASQAERLKQLEALAQTGQNAVSETALGKMTTPNLGFEFFAPEAMGLPRFFWRDEFLRRHTAQRLSAQNELSALEKKHSEAPVKNFTRKKTRLVSQVTAAKKSQALRLKALAAAEVSEYKVVINKLHLIEAEVIQRLHLDQSLKGERQVVANIEGRSNQIRFPRTDEIWLDEIDSYQSEIKACPELKEAKL